MRRTILIRRGGGRRIPSAKELKAAGFAVSAAVEADERHEVAAEENDGREVDDENERGSDHPRQAEDTKKPVDRTGAEDGQKD